MLRKVVISNAAEQTRTKMYDSLSGSEVISLSGDVYRTLGSIMENSKLVYIQNPLTAYEEFIKDLNNLYRINNLTPEQESNLIAVNEYLGSLDITIEYPISAYRETTQRAVNARYIKQK